VVDGLPIFIMQHGEMFLIAILLAMVFFAWPRHRPAQRKVEPERKARERNQRKP
jgi:hypothetical protein